MSTSVPGDDRATEPYAGTTAERRDAIPRLPAFADPAPVGLAGFALTTFALGFVLVGGVPSTALPMVLAVAIFYGGAMQLLAGMWAFAKGETFAAAAFSSYGAFWLTFWILNAKFAKEIPARDLGKAVGLYLVLWGVFTFYMWIASFRVSVAVNVVFLLLFIAYFVIGCANLVGNATLQQAGGGVACADAVAAWYTAFGAVTNATFGKKVIPLGDLSRA